MRKFGFYNCGIIQIRTRFKCQNFEESPTFYKLKEKDESIEQDVAIYLSEKKQVEALLLPELRQFQPT